MARLNSGGCRSAGSRSSHDQNMNRGEKRTNNRTNTARLAAAVTTRSRRGAPPGRSPGWSMGSGPLAIGSAIQKRCQEPNPGIWFLTPFRPRGFGDADHATSVDRARLSSAGPAITFRVYRRGISRARGTTPQRSMFGCGVVSSRPGQTANRWSGFSVPKRKSSLA